MASCLNHIGMTLRAIWPKLINLEKKADIVFIRLVRGTTHQNAQYFTDHLKMLPTI